MAVAGERKREKDLSHECCVWSSFMVVRLNSRSEEGEFRKWRRHGVRRIPGRIVGNLRDTGYFAIEGESRKNGVIRIRYSLRSEYSVGERQPCFVQEIARESYIGQKSTSERYISLLGTTKQNGYSIKNI